MNTKVAKKNNKGFTLIELIVVIAIIAVLAAILAPQYLRYVEKSRISVDCQGAAEIMSATKTAMADTDVYDSVTTFPAIIKWADNTLTDTAKTADTSGTANTDSKLLAEVKSTIGNKLGRKSKTLKKALWTVTVNKTGSDTVTVNGVWSNDTGSSLSNDDLKKFTEQSGGTWTANENNENDQTK